MPYRGNKKKEGRKEMHKKESLKRGREQEWKQEREEGNIISLVLSVQTLPNC